MTDKDSELAEGGGYGGGFGLDVEDVAPEGSEPAAGGDRLPPGALDIKGRPTPEKVQKAHREKQEKEKQSEPSQPETVAPIVPGKPTPKKVQKALGERGKTEKVTQEEETTEPSEGGGYGGGFEAPEDIPERKISAGEEVPYKVGERRLKGRARKGRERRVGFAEEKPEELGPVPTAEEMMYRSKRHRGRPLRYMMHPGAGVIGSFTSWVKPEVPDIPTALIGGARGAIPHGAEKWISKNIPGAGVIGGILPSEKRGMKEGQYLIEHPLYTSGAAVGEGVQAVLIGKAAGAAKRTLSEPTKKFSREVLSRTVGRESLEELAERGGSRASKYARKILPSWEKYTLPEEVSEQTIRKVGGETTEQAGKGGLEAGVRYGGVDIEDVVKYTEEPVWSKTSEATKKFVGFQGRGGGIVARKMHSGDIIYDILEEGVGKTKSGLPQLRYASGGVAEEGAKRYGASVSAEPVITGGRGVSSEALESGTRELMEETPTLLKKYTGKEGISRLGLSSLSKPLAGELEKERRREIPTPTAEVFEAEREREIVPTRLEEQAEEREKGRTAPEVKYKTSVETKPAPVIPPLSKEKQAQEEKLAPLAVPMVTPKPITKQKLRQGETGIPVFEFPETELEPERPTPSEKLPPYGVGVKQYEVFDLLESLLGKREEGQQEPIEGFGGGGKKKEQEFDFSPQSFFGDLFGEKNEEELDFSDFI